MALAEGTPQVEVTARTGPFTVAAKWLVDPDGYVVDASFAERADRNSTTVLALHGACRSLSGAQLVDLSNELRGALGKSGSRRARAFPPSTAAAYLRLEHTGHPYAVVGGRLESAAEVQLDSAVDAVAWLDRAEWRFDVFSSSKRLGGFESECRAGRVQRCVRLATELLVAEGGRGVVRVFNPLRGLVPVVDLTAKQHPVRYGQAQSREVRR